MVGTEIHTASAESPSADTARKAARWHAPGRTHPPAAAARAEEGCATATGWRRRGAEKLGTRTVTTGCGQGTVFGGLMDEIDQVRLPHDRLLRQSTLYALMVAVRHHESIYKQAGAVHGCALAQATVDGCEILMFFEDVGRHNAVDAIAGQMWLDGLDGADKIFYTTGRLTSEMVIKTAQMGIPFLVSRSGLTHMGWQIAHKIGLTMVGRAQGKHYLLFSGDDRFERD